MTTPATPTSNAPLLSVTLHSTEGGSDKIYALQLVAKGDGFAVNYQNGKRGGTMTNETRHETPVSREAAQKMYDSVLKEKLKKHYNVIGGTGSNDAAAAAGSVSEFQAPTTTRTDSNLRVQLLNAIDEDDAEKYINDPAWVAEQKYDGERRPVQIKGGAVTGVNRLGYEVSLPMSIVNEALTIFGNGKIFEIDGEIIGEQIFVFDVLSADGKDLRGQSLGQRLKVRDALLANQSSARSALQGVGTAYTREEKRALHDRLRKHGQEGMVFKRLDSLYEPGRPASGGDQLKLKFWKSATLEVSGLNTLAGKKSFSVQAYDHSGSAIAMGNVTMLEKVNVGDIVEIRYLNANLGGSLFQPTFLRKHADKTVNECQISQIKYKAAHQDVSQGLAIAVSGDLSDSANDDAVADKPKARSARP